MTQGPNYKSIVKIVRKCWRNTAQDRVGGMCLGEEGSNFSFGHEVSLRILISYLRLCLTQ